MQSQCEQSEAGSQCEQFLLLYSFQFSNLKIKNKTPKIKYLILNCLLLIKNKRDVKVRKMAGV
jgi:hypothetical protein